MKQNNTTACDSCNNYVYEEESGYYICDMMLDEDDAARFMSGTVRSCPYYRSNDEYEIVRHQN